MREEITKYRLLSESYFLEHTSLGPSLELSKSRLSRTKLILLLWRQFYTRFYTMTLPTFSSLFHGIHKADIGDSSRRLPGHPQTTLDRSDILQFLETDFRTPQLDAFSKWLWLVSTQDSSHVFSLTHQVAVGREITVTENPELHLVWHDHRVFVKPIPPFLLSHAFWSAVLEPEPSASTNKDAVYKSILGFMRTYQHLVQHPSDFALAEKHGLLPIDCNSIYKRADGENVAAELACGDENSRITYTSFVKFIQAFGPLAILDADVSPRYQYGQLRLGPLNFWGKFVLRKFIFFKVYGNYDAYFGRFYGPFLFTFGVLSILISSIQLGYSSQQGLYGTTKNSWRPLYKVGEGFCVAVMLVVCLIGVCLIVVFVFMTAREMTLALAALRRKKRKSNSQAAWQGQLDSS